MKIKGAIFDLDGTLLDSMPFWENLGSEYLKTKGIDPEKYQQNIKDNEFRPIS